MTSNRNEKFIMWTIVACFLLAFIINALAAIIFPPDESGEFPIYDWRAVMIIQFAGAFLLIALTVIAMKAEEEKQILAAAGFTAMAISFGVSSVSIFDIAEIVTFQQYERYYRITVSSNFLFIPALILIATYEPFKRWVRYFSFIASFPIMVSSGMFIAGIRDYTLLENVTNVGVLLISISWVCWGINIYINYRRDHKN